MKRLFLLIALSLLLFVSCGETDLAEDSTSNIIETTGEISVAEIDSETNTDGAVTSFPNNISDEIFAQINSDEYVALYCGDLLSGGEIWYDFLDKASRGEQASVLIVNYYPPQGQYDESSSIFLEEVRFNGSTYDHVLSLYPTDDEPSVSEYKYIVKYELEKDDVYVLVNKDTYTYEQIERAFSTSISTELIDFQWLVKIPK